MGDGFSSPRSFHAEEGGLRLQMCKRDSAGVLSISIRRSRAEAQRRQGVFDLAMGVGRVHALIQTLF